MALVAGADFGTTSVRVCVVDSERGRLGTGVGEYPLERRREDPDYATQRHEDHVRGLERAMSQALAAAGTPGASIEALAIDTTGSTVVAVDEQLEPLGSYYLWCDHRAWREAAELTARGRETAL